MTVRYGVELHATKPHDIVEIDGYGPFCQRCETSIEVGRFSYMPKGMDLDAWVASPCLGDAGKKANAEYVRTLKAIARVESLAIVAAKRKRERAIAKARAEVGA